MPSPKKSAGRFSTRHIASGKETVTTLVREELKKVFAEIISAIKTTNQNFSASENNLETIHESLVPSLSEADVDKIVSQIKHEIKSMESSSTSFKEQLQQATQRNRSAEKQNGALPG